MSYRYHGNYCGPGWTAGKWQDAKDANKDDFKLKPVDAFDGVCKTHDYEFWIIENSGWPDHIKRRRRKQADRKFSERIKELNAQGELPGVKDDVASWLVWALGPGPKVRTGDHDQEMKEEIDEQYVSDKFVTPEQQVVRQPKQQEISPPLKRQRTSLLEWAGDISGNTESVHNLRRKQQTKTPVITANSTMADNADGLGSNRANGIKETQLDTIQHVERGIPNYCFASLPYQRITKYAADKYTDDNMFRMTSPYDCMVQGTVVDQNAGAGQLMTDTQAADPSGDTVYQRASWFDYYASMYKYYSVVSCRWSMIFENLCNEPLWVHQMYCGPNTPPTLATNQDILAWKNVNSHYVRPLAAFLDQNGILAAQINSGGATGESDTANTTKNFATGNGVNNSGSNIIQLSGQYAPGDFTREIKQDNEVELWSLCTTNPALAERLLIRVKPESAAQATNDASNYNRGIAYRYHLKIEYLVEFKELKDGLKWPVNNQPATVTILNSTTTDETQT